MINEENLCLLIVEESKNDAESLANTLQHDGHHISFNHGMGIDDIETALKTQRPDIVICGSGDAVASPESVQKLLGKYEISPPVLVIVDETSEDSVVAAMKSGIASLVSYDQPDHLQLAFSKEVEALRLQQKLHSLSTALSASETRCHTLIANSSDAVAYIHEGMHIYANQPYINLFNIDTLDEVEGTPILDMISSEQRETFKDFLKEHEHGIQTGDTVDIDCISPAGEPFSTCMELAPATMEGEACIQIIIRVNASNSELEEKIKTLSRIDMLTGLSNRQHFMQTLEERINNNDAADQHRALIYITLDNFKMIREEAGIAAGDIVLRDIAELLETNSGKNDCLSHFGECSFVVLHYDADQDKTLGLSETLLQKIAGHLTEVNGRAITMTCSIGICTIKDDTHNAQTILSHADMACDVARTSGGNQIHTHSVVVDEQTGNEQEQEWDKIVRDTIAEERFYLAYQPIVSLQGDTRQRYEVLLRIIDEGGQVILPGQFISIAEKTGLNAEIDLWVINAAFQALAEQRQHHPEMTFFIKLSGLTLSDPGLPACIATTLKTHNLEGDGIVFEVPEQNAVNDLKSTLNFFKAMQELGCKVALEHYGESAQPQLLKHIPVDILKIDGALITGLGNNSENQSKVRDIIELAREHKIECIAECVNDAGSLASLWQLGVDYIQGNFVQEPCKSLEYDFDGEIA